LRIQSVHLTNFRNLADVRVEFGPKRNIIVGPNAQGKTNLLEAIHMLGVGRSHRDRTDANLVRFGEDFFRVDGLFEHIGVKTRIEIGYDENRKRIRVNGKDVRAANLIGCVGVVITSPDDIELVKGGPGQRRTFLDMAISQGSREYLSDLQQYVRAVAQRNRLIKRVQENRQAVREISVWDERLVEAGSRVVAGRLAFLGEIHGAVEDNYAAISGARSRLELPYQARGYDTPEISSAAGRRAGPEPDRGISGGLRRALAAARDQELARGHTLIGPHVDDFAFLADGRDVRRFGSEGEQRTAVLSLRCAEVVAIREKLGRYPIVLLDDVFAELDERRAAALTALISGFDQILLTSARSEPPGGEEMRRIAVREGRIEQVGQAGEGGEDP
jgi:DNA replication and repair protein RecF